MCVKRSWIAVVLGVALAGSGWAAPRESFAAFRRQLVSALRRKDGEYVMRLAAKDISWSFGDAPGRAGFAKAYGLPGKSSPFYGKLLGLLGKGSEKLEGGLVQVPAHAAEGLRAGFEQRRGKWVMTYFVAGD